MAVGKIIYDSTFSFAVNFFVCVCVSACPLLCADGGSFPALINGPTSQRPLSALSLRAPAPSSAVRILDVDVDEKRPVKYVVDGVRVKTFELSGKKS